MKKGILFFIFCVFLTFCLHACPALADDSAEIIKAAGREKNINKVQMLLRKNSRLANAKGAGRDGETVLQVALSCGNDAIVKLLISYNADVNAKGGKYYHNSPYFATNAAMTNLLISKGARIEERDIYGHTPLIDQSRNGRAEVVSALLSRGANINARSKDGNLPIHYAARFCHVSTANALLSKGAGVNAKNKDGDTPLILALREVSGSRMAELLISRGADVRARSEGGYTPLHLACMKPAFNYNVIKMLIAKGADVNARTNDGKTPLALAEKTRNKRVIDLLKSRGGTK